MTNLGLFYLTCADKSEADRIAKTLLGKQLIACAKKVPASSDFRWQGKIRHEDEVVLIMDSRLDLFTEIEEETAKIHSYDTFVLQAVPVSEISKEAAQWLAEELKK